MAVNLAWPRAEFFGPAWYQQYVAMFMIPGIAIVGAAYYWLRVRGKQQVLREHRPDSLDLVPGVAAAPGGESTLGIEEA